MPSSVVHQKTEQGRQALKERAAWLTPKQRSAFIRCNGSRTVFKVIRATSGLGMTQDDVEAMVLGH